MFDVGVPELVLILVVALIVFGPGKLPEVGAALGKAIGEFRRATRAVNDEVQSITQFPEAETRPALPSSVEATTIKENVAPTESSETKR